MCCAALSRGVPTLCIGLTAYLIFKKGCMSRHRNGLPHAPAAFSKRRIQRAARGSRRALRRCIRGLRALGLLLLPSAARSTAPPGPGKHGMYVSGAGSLGH